MFPRLLLALIAIVLSSSAWAEEKEGEFGGHHIFAGDVFEIERDHQIPAYSRSYAEDFLKAFAAGDTKLIKKMAIDATKVNVVKGDQTPVTKMVTLEIVKNGLNLPMPCAEYQVVHEGKTLPEKYYLPSFMFATNLKRLNKVYDECRPVFVGYTCYVVMCSWWSNKLSENEFLDHPPNAKYLLVQLYVANADKKQRMIPPFKLIDETGAEHEADSRGWLVKGSIGLIENLNPGVNKAGFVVFDVPENRNYRIKLSGGFWSLKDAYVAISPKTSLQDAFKTADPKMKKFLRCMEKLSPWIDNEAKISPDATPEQVTDKLNQRIDELDNVEEKARQEQERARQERRIAEEKATQEWEAAAEKAKWRNWTDSTGQHTIEAKFSGLAMGKVKLTKQDGTTIQVPVDKLSEEDQAWIEKRKK